MARVLSHEMEVHVQTWGWAEANFQILPKSLEDLECSHHVTKGGSMRSRFATFTFTLKEWDKAYQI